MKANATLKEGAMSFIRTRWFLGMAVGGAIALGANSASAQITPDRTLPNNSNVTRDAQTFNITGGTQAGRNLFHSFQEFSVPTGGTASFNNAPDIQNIFSRVTGGLISNIDGLIKANYGANLFLINPNGIIFGKNASLNIGGSFVGSTASSIKFADGAEFSANATQTTPLLSISIPIGLQFRENPGNILNQSQRVDNTDTDNTTDTHTGLQVQTGKTLALVGGNVSLDGAYLSAPSGRVELGGLAGAGNVELNMDGNNLNFNFLLGMQLADVRLLNAYLNVYPERSDEFGQSLSPAGSIAINARNIDVLQKNFFHAQADYNKGGEITLNATGAISLHGNDTEETGSSPLDGVTLNADGTSGVIKIQGRSISLMNAFLSVSDPGGYAGDISLQADDTVSIAKSGFGSNTGFGKVAGKINIQGRSISITDNTQIDAFGTSGVSGTININASDSVSISGSRTFLETLAQYDGRGGNINVNVKAGSLFLSDGAKFDASTFGNALGGNIVIKANSVTLSGINSGLSSTTKSTNFFRTTVGQGGSISITTPGQLTVRDGAKITASSEGEGNAGNLNIIARSLKLDNGSITTTSRLGQGGNIDNLQVQDLLLLGNHSQISTSSGTNQNGGGNGGNITINAKDGFIVAAPNENSDITANAFNGQGGKITINATGIYGMVQRSQQDLERLHVKDLNPDNLSTNDITAFSQQNPSLSNTVTINTPDVDPSRGLIKLPVNVVDPTTLIAQNPCQRGVGSTFTITGRGGLLPNPNQALTSDNVRVDLVTPVSSKVHSAFTTIKPSKKNTVKHIVPAQGWVFNDKGQVVLTAYDPKNTGSQRTRQQPASCVKR